MMMLGLMMNKELKNLMTKEKWDALIESGGEQIEHLAMRVFDEDELLQERIAELTFINSSHMLNVNSTCGRN